MKKLAGFTHKHIFIVIVGNMIGVGVFITPDWVASQTGSPLQYIAVWILGAMIALSGGISYAILANTFPRNGGDYQYLKKTSHKLVARAFASAMLWFAFPGSIASLALGGAEYTIRIVQMMYPQFSIPTSVIAFIFISLFLLVNLNRFKIAITFQQILVSVLIISVSIFLFSATLIYPNSGFVSQTTFTGNWFMAVLAVYFSYIGFASIGYIGGEIKLTFRELKKWAVISVSTVAVIYLLINLVYINFIPFEQLQSEKATVFLILKSFPFILKLSVLTAIVGAALGSLNVVMITGSRLFEFILSDHITSGKQKHFNLSLFLITIIGMFYLLTNTFEKILFNTTWSILIFSFITIFAFTLYAFRTNIKRVTRSGSNLLAVSFFTITTGTLSIYGFIKFSRMAFSGFIYIIIGFIIFILLFYFLSVKKRF